MFKIPKPLKRQDQQYTIYALIDPRDNSIRYVGMSKDAQFRLYQHSHRSTGGESEQAKRWISELQQSNLFPNLQVLETIEMTDDAYSIACEREHYWIEKLLRADTPLLNVKAHGMGNEITANKRCRMSRPHKQFRLYRLLADGFVEILPHRRKRKFNEERSRAISFDRCISLRIPWDRLLQSHNGQTLQMDLSRQSIEGLNYRRFSAYVY